MKIENHTVPKRNRITSTANDFEDNMAEDNYDDDVQVKDALIR